MSRTRILAVAIVAMSVLALMPAVAEVPAAPDQVAPEHLSASALGTLGQVEFATDLIR